LGGWWGCCSDPFEDVIALVFDSTSKPASSRFTSSRELVDNRCDVRRGDFWCRIFSSWPDSKVRLCSSRWEVCGSLLLLNVEDGP
jgi:hypothetical protein